MSTYLTVDRCENLPENQGVEITDLTVLTLKMFAKLASAKKRTESNKKNHR